jgi:hypothetical protein
MRFHVQNASSNGGIRKPNDPATELEPPRLHSINKAINEKSVLLVSEKLKLNKRRTSLTHGSRRLGIDSKINWTN